MEGFFRGLSQIVSGQRRRETREGEEVVILVRMGESEGTLFSAECLH